MSTVAKPTALVDYLRLATHYLHKCGSDSARLDAEVLLGHVLELDRIGLYVNFDRPLEPKEVDAYRETLRRRCRGTPVAYITGHQPFMSTSLHVTPAVLIPRPETELLVEAVNDWLLERPDEGPLYVADVGTGSGAIAVSIALAVPSARLFAIDVSSDALAVARANVAGEGLEERVELVAGDLLTPLLVPPRGDEYAGRLHAVVSNPPYVTTEEMALLPTPVREYEPRIALEGGADGLDFYRRLVPAASDVLRPGGLLALEIGHEQGAAVMELLHGHDGWRDVQLRQDFAALDRIVLAVKE